MATKRKTKIISISGAGRNSGKTTLVETLVRELSRRGSKVATIKKIHEENFTIDKEEKDTWRHAKAGASVVVAAAPKEIALIKKIKEGRRLKEALKILSKEKLDFIIIEGNAEELSKKLNIINIFICRNEEELMEEFKDIDKTEKKFIGIASLTPQKFKKVKPYHAQKEIGKIASLVSK